MNELVDEVNKRMEEADVDEKKRKQTKIGWMIFWSDSFLNSFIKQKLVPANIVSDWRKIMRVISSTCFSLPP